MKRTAIYCVALAALAGAPAAAQQQGNQQAGGPSGVLRLEPLTLPSRAAEIYRPATLMLGQAETGTGGPPPNAQGAVGQTAAPAPAQDGPRNPLIAPMYVQRSFIPSGFPPVPTYGVRTAARLDLAVNGTVPLNLPVLGYLEAKDRALPFLQIQPRPGAEAAPAAPEQAYASNYAAPVPMALGLDFLSSFGGFGGIGSLGRIPDFSGLVPSLTPGVPSLPSLPGLNFPR